MLQKEVLMNLSEVRTLIQQHQAFYEVRPNYVVVQTPEQNGAYASRRVQAGFEVDIYGVNFEHKLPPAAEYSFAYASLQEVVQAILPHTADLCSLEVIPLPSSSVIDARRRMQWLGMLRIRITHGRGLEQPAGPSEERALKELEARLQELGISSKSGRV
jgi:hypothetical protein